MFKEHGEEEKSPEETKVKPESGENANTDARASAGIASQEGLNNSDTLCKKLSDLRTETPSVNLTEGKSP